MTYPTITTDPQRQAHYESMRAKGESHNMAEMLALQQLPFGRDEDRLLMEGNEAGKILSHGFGSKAGPAAISCAADMRWIAKERGLDVESDIPSLNITQPERPPMKSIPIAEDIVDDHVEREIAMDPSKGSNLEKTRAEVKEKLTPAYKKQ